MKVHEFAELRRGTHVGGDFPIVLHLGAWGELADGGQS
jgi:hypothetical protein